MSRQFWKRLLSDPFSAAAVVYLVVLALLALLADVIAPYEPMAQNVIARYGTPSTEFWLGTDDFGRDLFSRVIYGARYAFQSLFVSMGIAVFIGVPAGLIAGYSGGRLDRAITWVIDVIFTLPAIMMGFAIVAILGSGLTSAMIALGIVFSSRFARLARGVMIAEKSELYVDGARVGGLSTARIMFRHILPNVAPSLIVQVAILSSAVLILEATFSFLGLGVNAGEPAWGRMLAEGQTRLRQHAWGVIPPGAALVTTVVAFNLLGDGIRDAIGRNTRNNQLTASKKQSAADLQSFEHATNATLSVRGLEVQFPSESGNVSILRDVNLEIHPGETVGLVGESGSGKSMTALSALGLVPAPGRVTAGSVQFEGREITTLGEKELNTIRGKEIAIIFQEPWAALNPSMKIATQLIDRLVIHEGLSKTDARQRALELLKTVQMPDAEHRLDDYPHQLSGGMAQRVGIALALACNPKLLIADEPTTALDVTVQGQILDLLAKLQKEFGMAVLFITHDLGVVAEIADRVAVMYAGEVVEIGTAQQVFEQPRHPYSKALLETLPHQGRKDGKLPVIDGLVPPPSAWPTGCRFHPRCHFAVAGCSEAAHIPLVPLNDNGQSSRCIRLDEIELSPLG